MSKELKIAIIKWLVENKNQWQRVNACTLKDIKVSDTAEMMYENSYIKVGNIKW